MQKSAEIVRNKNSKDAKSRPFRAKSGQLLAKSASKPAIIPPFLTEIFKNCQKSPLYLDI